MVVMLMEVALLWNLRKGLQEGEVVVIVTTVVVVTVTVTVTTAVVVAALVNSLAEVLLLQDQAVASIVDLMAIGLGTAKPVTGRTNVIVVENVAI